jgi:hypothetical protein
MPINTRQKLIDYCLRQLGAPVVEINVDDDQLSDRVDDALKFMSEYHFDGVERVYLKYVLTAEDIARKYLLLESDNTNSLSASDRLQSISEEGLTGGTPEHLTGGVVPIDNLITSVTSIFHVSQQTIDMFDVRYQYALNDLYTFGTIDMVQYDLTQQYLSLLRQYLSPDKSVNFSRVTNKLEIYMDWKIVRPGAYLIIDCYRILDPRVHTEIYEDRMLKKYLTALIKRQWGTNMSKYSGIKLPGDVTLRGVDIFNESQKEVDEIEVELVKKYELPIDFMMG